MARTNNLENFLNDVAGAIKTKRGYQSSQKIPAANFDTEISAIETGIDTSDANMVAADLALGKTGYARGSKITGTRPNPTYQSKEVEYTSNGIRTITADQGYDGLSQVKIDVDIPLHRYDTVQEMNADINNVKPDDVGIVYWEGEGHPTEISTFDSFILKDSITLSREVLEGESFSASWRARRADSDWFYYTFNVNISRTSITTVYNDNGSNPSVSYTSSDGIHYTKTSGSKMSYYNEIPYSFGSEYGESTWYPLCAEVIFCTTYDFEGLFSVKRTTGDDILYNVPFNDTEMIVKSTDDPRTIKTHNSKYHLTTTQTTNIKDLYRLIMESLSISNSTGFSGNVFMGSDDNWYLITYHYTYPETISGTTYTNRRATYMFPGVVGNGPYTLSNNQLVGEKSRNSDTGTNAVKLYQLDIDAKTFTDVSNLVTTRYQVVQENYNYITFAITTLPFNMKTFPIPLTHGWHDQVYKTVLSTDTIHHLREIANLTYYHWYSNSYALDYTTNASLANTRPVYKKEELPFNDLSGKAWVASPNQFTLTDVSQLEDDVVGYGPNGVITGDGSIWNKIPDTFRMETVLNLPVVYSNENAKLYGSNRSLVSNVSDNHTVHYLKKTTSNNPDYVVGEITSYTNTSMVIPSFDNIDSLSDYAMTTDDHYGIGIGYNYSTWENTLVRKDFANDTVLFSQTGYDYMFKMNNTLYIRNNTTMYKWAPEDTTMSTFMTLLSTSYTMNQIDNDIVCIFESTSNRSRLTIYDGTTIRTIIDENASIGCMAFKNNNTLYILYNVTGTNSYTLLAVDLTTFVVTTLYTDTTFAITDITSTWMTMYEAIIDDGIAYIFSGKYDWGTGTTAYNGLKVYLNGSALTTFNLYLNGDQLSGDTSPTYIADGVYSLYYSVQEQSEYISYYCLFNTISYDSTLGGYSIDTYNLLPQNLSGNAIENNELNGVSINMYPGSQNTYTFDGLDLISFNRKEENYMGTSGYKIEYTISNITKYNDSTYANYDIAVINGLAVMSSHMMGGANHAIQIGKTETLSQAEYNQALETSESILGEE